MLLHPPLRRLRETVENGHKLCRWISRAPAIAGDLAKTCVHTKKMRQDARTTPEDRADQKPPQPGSVLQRVDRFPSEEGDRGGERGWHILGVFDRRTPRSHARIFVPVEIIDHWIATFRRTRGNFRQEAVRAFVDGLEPGELASERTIVLAFVWREPLFERIDLLLRAPCAPCPSASGTPARPISAFKPADDNAH